MGIMFLGNPYGVKPLSDSCTGYGCTSNRCNNVDCDGFSCNGHFCENKTNTSSLDDDEDW